MVESQKAGKYNDPYIMYLAGRSWQCADSPSGAHHWVFDDKDKKFHCKYCGKAKRLPLSWQEWQSKDRFGRSMSPMAGDYPRGGLKDSG